MQDPEGFSSRMYFAATVPLHLCCCHCSLVLTRCEWVWGIPIAFNVVWLSYGNITVYWAFFFLLLGYYEDYFLLSCLNEVMILYNNSVSLNRTLVIEGL